MTEVYVLICRTSVDYEGSSDEIIDVFRDREAAETELRECPETFGYSSTEHFINTYKLK